MPGKLAKLYKMNVWLVWITTCIKSHYNDIFIVANHKSATSKQ